MGKTELMERIETLAEDGGDLDEVIESLLNFIDDDEISLLVEELFLDGE